MNHCFARRGKGKFRNIKMPLCPASALIDKRWLHQHEYTQLLGARGCCDAKFGVPDGAAIGGLYEQRGADGGQ